MESSRYTAFVSGDNHFQRYSSVRQVASSMTFTLSKNSFRKHIHLSGL